MRYMATTRWKTKRAVAQAVVAGNADTSEALALRHARAMAAVLRAAKAWQRASSRFNAACNADAMAREAARILRGQLDAEKRLLAATARLVAVEKEVVRGSK